MDYTTRKVCLVGAPGAGKTSLSTRFLTDTFSEQYLSTVGVKVGSREIELGDHGRVKLVVWDIGCIVAAKINASYIKGAAGVFYVVDGTRKDTLPFAQELRVAIEGVLGSVPSLMLINKTDLIDQWEIDNETLQSLTAAGNKVLLTSAKLGVGVEDAFSRLTRLILQS